MRKISEELSKMVHVYESYDELSEAVAQRVFAIVTDKPDAVICVATGESPKGVYQRLNMRRELFEKVRILKLDEWGGIPSTDPSTCETYIVEHIVEPLGLDRNQLLGFISDALDVVQECKRVEQLIMDLGGIDVCILGMGTDGHIGLNFPEERLIPSIHSVPEHFLTHSMVKQAKVKPTHGFTLGIKEVLMAKEILLIVSGQSKREAFATLLEQRITTHFPASLLWLHSNLHIFCDVNCLGKEE